VERHRVKLLFLLFIYLCGTSPSEAAFLTFYLSLNRDYKINWCDDNRCSSSNLNPLWKSLFLYVIIKSKYKTFIVYFYFLRCYSLWTSVMIISIFIKICQYKMFCYFYRTINKQRYWVSLSWLFTFFSFFFFLWVLSIVSLVIILILNVFDLRCYYR
jgi:hypothetical protein